MDTEPSSSKETTPDYVIEMADKIQKQFTGYRGPQVSYLMEDLVGLSMDMLDEMSRMNDYDLREVKERFYPQWSTSDFRMLLDLLKERDEEMGFAISSAREELSETLE